MRIQILAALLLFSLPLRAADLLITTNTLWSAITTGTGPGGQPGSADNITVRGNVTLTVNVANAVCNNLNIGSGGANNTTSILLFNNGSALTVVNFNINGAQNRRGSLNMTNGGLLKITGVAAVTNLNTFTPGTGTIEYSGAGNQTASSTLSAVNPYNNLILSGGGVKTIAGVSLSGKLTLRGTVTANGVPSYGTGASLEYNKSVNHVTGSEFPLTFTSSNGIIINSAANVLLNENKTVQSSLTILNGVLETGAFNLNLGVSCLLNITAPSSAKMIAVSGTGRLSKAFGANGSFLFPIGDLTGAAEYSPVTVTVTGTAYASASVSVQTTNSKHSSNASSTNYLQRYWTLSQTGITNCTVTANTVYVPADISGTEGSVSGAWHQGTFNQLTNPWIKTGALSGGNISFVNIPLDAGNTVLSGISLAGPSASISGGNVTVCPNASVSLNALPSGNGPFAYSWSPANGLSSVSVANPVATVSATSSYTVTVTDGNGITFTTNTTITADVGPTPPMPGGITGNIIACDGEAGVVYSVSPAPLASSYSWSVPSGAVIASGNGTREITIDFPNPFTSGNVCVISENNCGIPSAPRCTTATNVSQYLPARITGPLNVCAGTSVSFEGLRVRGATSYNWTLPPGMTITSGAGTRFITVDVGTGAASGQLCFAAEYNCGSSLWYCINININSSNMPGGITGPESVCANSSGIVYSISPISGATSYTWSLPSGHTIVSGSSTNVITVNIGSSPVAGAVCVYANFPCGPGQTRCKNVSISGIAVSAISGSPNICAGTNGLVYSVSSVPGATNYNWTLPAGLTVVAGNGTRSITVNSDSSFRQGGICVTVTTACGTSNPVCLTVSDFTSVTPGGITGPSVVCPNTSGTVYSIGAISGAVSYDWLLPDGITITGGQNTRMITVDISSAFTVGDIGVIANGPCGKKSLVRWNSKITTVNTGMPETITADNSICNGTTVKFTVSPAINGAASYSWTLPQGTSITSGWQADSSTISVDISAGFKQGEICVRAVTSCGISGYMKCQTINVVPNTPSPVSGQAGVCAGATGLAYSVPAVSGAASYNWILPAGWSVTSGAGTNSITADASAGFTQGQIRVNGISACGIPGGTRALNVSSNPATPGNVTGPAVICNGNAYTYSITPVPGASSYQWTLPAGVTFSPGPPSNTTSVSVVAGPGFAGGQICVSALTSCGGVSTSKCFDVGFTPPTPGAITGLTGVCQGATSITYSVSPVSGANGYSWTVPAGITITSGQGTNSVTVNVSGSFTSGNICVAALNDCGLSGNYSCLGISLTPTGSPTINVPANFCPGSARTLSVSGLSGAASFQWSVPAGLTMVGGNETSSIIVVADGSFTSGNVCVTPVSPCGQQGQTYCQNITAASPVPPASIVASSLACAGTPVSFSIPAITGAGSFTWTAPAGMNIVSGQGSATMTAVPAPGFTFGQVCVTANSGCGIQSAQYCQTINSTPPTPGGITAPASICENSSNNMVSVSPVAGAASYNWTVPSGITITGGNGSNAIMVSAVPGFTSGQISVTAVSACGTQGAARSINISSTMSSPGTITRPVSVCPNTSGLVFSVPVMNGATSYQWTVPATFNITSGGNTNSITVNVSPAFVSGQVCVTAISACGTPGISSCITVNNLPNQPSSITGQLKGVCGQTLSYSVANAAGAASYTWTAPAGATIVSGQGTRFVDISFSNSFTSGQIQVYTTNACGNSTVRSSPVMTGAPDKPASITGPVSVCANQSGYNYSVTSLPGAAAYNWTLPAGASITNGAGTNAISASWGTTAGNVVVSASNSCGTSASTSLAVSVSCRISGNDALILQTHVYPVPAEDEITIEFNAETSSTVSIRLIDLSGRTVISKELAVPAGTHSEKLDVGQLNRGTYFLRVLNENGESKTVKLLLN